MANEDDFTVRAVAEAAAIAKQAATTATQTAVAIAGVDRKVEVVDRKVEAVLQETSYIKTEQVRTNDQLTRHVGNDEASFNHLEAGQSDLQLKVALLTQENINANKGFSINWGTIASIITMLIAALIAYLIRGQGY